MELNSNEERPLLDVNQFNELQGAVNLFRDMLPVVVDVLASQVPTYEPETIFVDIGRVQTLDELEDAVSDLKRLFDLMSINGGFSFSGVAQGSDWIAVIPWNEIPIAAYHIALLLMDKYNAIRAGKTDDEARAEIGITRRMAGSDDPVTDGDVQQYLGLLTDSQMEEDWEQALIYLDQALSGNGNPNEARNKLKQAVKLMHEQTDKGRRFYPALSPPSNIFVEGDNNTITINYVAPSRNTPALDAAREDEEDAE